MSKILCAIDDTEHSVPAVKLAGTLAGALGAELILLAVNQVLSGYGSTSTVMWSGAETERILARAVDDAKTAGASVVSTATIADVDPADAIVAFAKTNDVHHIVIGSGGKGFAARMVLGSVSGNVVNRAHCAVTVAR